MSIKFNISYTYEWELEQILELLEPVLQSGCGYKVLDGSTFSHCYIPKNNKGMEMAKISGKIK